MKILVTGGCGFIGHNVCLNLVSKGHQVVCVDKYKAPFVNSVPEIEFIEKDLFSSELGDTISAKEFPKVDGIIHLASSSIPETSNLDIYKDASENILGALRLLNYAKITDTKFFVFMSSGGTVYGPQPYDCISEDAEKSPICSYGATKLAIENYMRLYNQQYGICTLALRLANPYGRFQRVDSKQGVIPIFCRKALLNEEIQIFGDGSIQRDFIYIDDVCSAIDRVIDTYYRQYIILNSKTLPTEINIGSEIGTSLNEILYAISHTLNKELKVRYINSRKFDVQKNVLDITLAKKYLNWQPNVVLEDGIRMLLEYYKGQMSNKV